MSENNNDFPANNNGIIKTKKGLVLAIVGGVGFIFYLIILGALSTIPPLQWLTVTLTGVLFFVAGIIFLALSKNSYNLPLIALMIGVLLMYMSITEKFFPAIREGLGDKATGGIMIVFAILMVVFPFMAVSYYKGKYKTTVYAEVIHVEHHRSRTTRGHHGITYRPIYQFTYSGKEYTVTDKVSSSGSHPSTGEERELLIDDKHPERFVDIERLKTRPVTSYIAPLIVLALGVYLMVA
ncbi:MAG: hypothetical protein IKW90_02515 [Lachnospiraceae bacterium]|nr:hypothetical protein [Lachnospiraceae bacterium]